MKDKIIEIFKSKDLQDVSIELVEKTLDNQMAEGIIKEVPILKTLIAVKNIYNSFTDRIFIKKIMEVLLELGDLNLEQKEDLIRELDTEDENGIEKILLAIDRLETIKKCKVYGRLCKLKAKGKVSLNNFLRLTKLLQDAYLDDLILITDFKKNEKKELWEGDYYSIISLGLIFQQPSEQSPIERNRRSNEYEPEFNGGEIKFYYLLSDLGESLLDVYYELFPENKK